jgi:hypothetical protein
MLRSPALKRLLLCMALGLALGTILSEVAFRFLDSGQTRPPQVVEIDIPAGTAAEVQAGRADPSLPTALTFVIGDTLLVQNNDSAVHTLGPLLIPPGTSGTMKLDSPDYSAVNCSFQPSKYLGLTMESPLNAATRTVGILQASVPMGVLFSVYGLFAIPIKKQQRGE